ncbi:DNA primase family protein, partial [Leptothoe spongobia]
EYGFTWQLPYEYLPGVTCDPILEWLRWAANEDETVVQLIRACLKAMVMGRPDFQRYLEVIGGGGTGKGTLIRLIQALLGRSNTVSTSLSRIASSRFETSRFMGKRLVFIPDADYNPTAVDVLKQLTGEDYIPWERKGENADYTDGFSLEGWVMVATNKEVIASDHTNALFRRRIPIYFNRIVPDGQRRSLIEFAPDGSLRGEFAKHLPGLFNWVLEMPHELMEAYIRNPRQYVGAMAEFQATSLLKTDSLAQWVNDRVVVDEKSWTKIGDKSNPKANCLYANYVDYCESANVKPLSLSKFSSALENLLQTQLGIDAQRKRERNRGSGFTGIRLIGVDSIGQPDSFVSPETVSNALKGNYNHDECTLLSTRDIQRLSNLYETDGATFDKEIERLSEPQMEFFYQKISTNGRHPVNAG